MALQISLDLSAATFRDLSGFMDSARAAGAGADTVLKVEDDKLVITIEGPTIHHRPDRSHQVVDEDGRGVDERKPNFGPVGEQAIRSVIDILSGRQEPPRRGDSFGHF